MNKSKIIRLIAGIMFFFTLLWLKPSDTFAAVAIDAASESHATGVSSTSEASFSWNHTPVGTPKGVVVFVFTISSTAYDTGVTYGGTAMSLVSGGAAVDTANEPGYVRTYFLGSSVPTSNPAQIIVSRTNNATEMYAIAFTVTANYDTEVYTSGIVLLQENQAASEQNVSDGSPGSNSLRFAGAYYGGNSPAPAGSNSTGTVAGVQDNDLGAYGCSAVYETTAGQGSRPVGFSASTDDLAAVHLAVREILPTYTISGKIYGTNESTQYTCATSGNVTVNLKVNGSGSYTDTCNTDTGDSFSIAGVTVSAGQTITVYTSGGTLRAAHYLVSSGADKSDVDLYTDRVIVRDDNDGSVSDADILAGNTADSDDLVTTSGTDIVVGSSYETHIFGSDTFAPADNVSTGFLHIPTGSVFSAGSNTLTLTGTSGTLITRVGTFTQGTGTVSVTSASGTPTLLSAATTFHALTINSTATVINDGAAVTLENASGANLTITSGVLNFSTTPTGPGGTNGTFTISSGATACFGGNASNTSATCDSGTSATTAVTMPTFQIYTFNSASTVRYLSDAATSISNISSFNYGNLIFNPKLTSGRTYTFAGLTNINGDFTINPQAASSLNLRVDLGGTTTIALSKTTTIQATDSATSILYTRSSSTDRNLTSGFIYIGAGGTLASTDSTPTNAASTISLSGISGTLFTRIGSFTQGNSTVSIEGGSSAPTLNSGTITFYNFTHNGSLSSVTTTSADAITVSNNVNINTNRTLELASGQVFTHSGSTLTINGTISGSGTYIYQSSTAFPTTGIISSVLRMDSTNNDQTLSGSRTYGGDVELYNNSGSNARVITLGSAGSQTLTFSGNLTLNAANTQSLTVTGATNNPNMTITGNVTSTAGGGAENLTPGSGTWAISGNLTLTDVNTFTATGSTIQMNGTSKVLTSASETLNNFSVTGGSVQFADQTTIAGNLLITSGSLDLNGQTVSIAGNFDNDAAMTHNNASVTFNASSGTKTIDGDGTGSEAFYDVTFADGGSGPTYQLTDLLDVNNDLTISGGELDANAQALSVQGSWNNSGGTFTANGNTVTFDDTDGGETLAGTMTGSSSFSSVDFNDGVTSGAWTFSNNATFTGSFDISGGSVTAPSGGTLTIAGNFTNDDIFVHNSGTVIFNTTGNSTLAYSGNTTFYNLTISAAGKQVYFDDAQSTIITDNGTLTIQGTDCTNKIYLDSVVAGDNIWDLNVSTTGTTVDIDYADVQDSNSTNAISADNSTEVNLGNTNWTITNGVCAPPTPVETMVKGTINVRGGVNIK